MIRAVDVTTEQPEVQSKIEPFLLEVADVVNTTLDLDTTLRRVAELVRKVVDYEIFAILLLNEKTQDLRIRFQVGYPKEVADRMRIKVGDGVTGLRSEEHTSELQSQSNLVCRLLLEKKNKRHYLYPCTCKQLI